MSSSRNTPAAPQSGATEGRNESAGVSGPENVSGPVAALLPCPFCGGRVRSYEYFEPPRGNPRWAVICDEPGCEVEPAVTMATKGEAEAVWNRRPQPGDRLTGLCGLSAREAMREPMTPSENIRQIVKDHATGLRRLAGIPHTARSPMEHERDDWDCPRCGKGPCRYPNGCTGEMPNAWLTPADFAVCKGCGLTIRLDVPHNCPGLQPKAEPRPANEPRWIDDAGRPWPATEEPAR